MPGLETFLTSIISKVSEFVKGDGRGVDHLPTSKAPTIRLKTLEMEA